MDEADFEDLMRIQRMMASRLAQETEQDNQIKVLDVINSMLTGKKKKVATEEVIIECVAQGMTEGEVTATISRLKTDRLITEPEPGFLTLV
jgi:DNA replicative helicase MCM subunit Mcm2 (Cdc46/Mcm family)